MVDNDYAQLAFAVTRWRHFGELPAHPERLLEPFPEGYAEAVYGRARFPDRTIFVGFDNLDPELDAVTRSVPSIDEWAATVDLDVGPDRKLNVLVFREERVNARRTGQRLLWVTGARRDVPGGDLQLDYIMDSSCLQGRFRSP